MLLSPVTNTDLANAAMHSDTIGTLSMASTQRCGTLCDVIMQNATTHC